MVPPPKVSITVSGGAPPSSAGWKEMDSASASPIP